MSSKLSTLTVRRRCWRAEAEEVLLFVVPVSFQLPQRRGASHPAQAPDGRVHGRRVEAGRGQCGRHARRLREHVGQEEVRPALVATARSSSVRAAASAAAAAAARRRDVRRQSPVVVVALRRFTVRNRRRPVCGVPSRRRRRRIVGVLRRSAGDRRRIGRIG